MTNILITGAGSGMGQELARRAIARGDRLFAGTLAPQEAEALGQHANLTTLTLDVGSDSSVDAAFAEIDRQLAGASLDLVINCAGIAPSGAVEVTPASLLTHTLNINAVGSARMIGAALPRLRGSGGRILLFASLWGKVAGPMLSAYCASKHATEAIVDSARRETEGQGVDIVLIEPGVVRTNMVRGSVTDSRADVAALPASYHALYGDLYEKFARMIDRESGGGVSVAQAADVIERAAFTPRPKTRYTIGSDARAVIALARILSDRALDGVFRMMLNKKDKTPPAR